MEPIKEAAEVVSAGGKRVKPGNKKWPIILGVIAGVLAAVYLGLCAYASSREAFWPNTFLLSEDVSGLTAAEAAQTLEAALPEIALCVYDLPEENTFYDASMASDDADAPPHVMLTLAELGVSLDPEVVAQAAFETQHGSSWLKLGKEYWAQAHGRVLTRYNGGSTYQVEDALMAEAAAQAAQALSCPAQDTSWSLGGDSIQLHAAQDGRQVDEAALLEAMRSLSWVWDLSLKAPAETLPAQTLTAQEIYDRVAGEMRNAAYDAATDTILPERLGAEFDVTAAQAALDAAEPGETVTLSAVIETPEVTAAELEAVLFRDVLGEAKTKVGGTAARKSNVQLSASSINGYVMNSGDVFSYNGVVGQRTAANGYKPAPAYVKGETVDEIGGGICQTSSTLYLACLRGNLEITERYAHRYIPSYIDAGMDATVSWGGPDYKFTNDTSYPIKIVTRYENGYLTVKLLGTNVTGITAKMTNERLSTTNFEVVYEESADQAAGTQSVKTTAYTGSKWRTYRHLYDADGKLISSAYEATSDYKARNKVILVAPGELPGAKSDTPAAPAVTPAPTPETPVPTTPEPSVPPAETPVPDVPAQETPETTDPSILVLPELSETDTETA